MSHLFLLKAGSIKDHPGYVLYGSPPRWHLFNKEQHADPGAIHYHAKKTYHVAAVKKLMDEHNKGAKSAGDMRGEVEHLAGFMQGEASRSARVTEWRQSFLAGRAPRPAELRAFEAMAHDEPDKAARLLREVMSKLGDGNLAAGLLKMKGLHRATAVAGVKAASRETGERLAALEAEKARSKRKDGALRAAVAHLETDAGQGDLPAGEKREDAALVARLRGELDDADGPVGTDGIAKVIEEARLPTGNVNKKSMDAMLDRLVTLVGAGDPDAVLAQKWGSNTYAKRVAKLAARVVPAMRDVPKADLRKWATARSPFSPLNRRAVPLHLLNIERHPALENPDVHAGVLWMAQSAGWQEVGGLAMRNQAGDFVGRTSWLPREEWYFDKPADLREEHFAGAARKMERGGELSLPERRALDFMIHYITAADMAPEPETGWSPDFEEMLGEATTAAVDALEEESALSVSSVSTLDDWHAASEDEREAELDRLFG